MKLVYFDLETGGFEPYKHPIIQFAGVALDAGKEVDSIEVKIQFDPANADPQALESNCYSPDVWKDEAVPEIAACPLISKFLAKHADLKRKSKTTGRTYYVAQLIGHNADKFDAVFLRAFYKRLGEFSPASQMVLCTYQRALHYFNENPHLPMPSGFKLTELCEYFGIPIANAHDAMADVRAVISLHRKLIGVDS